MAKRWLPHVHFGGASDECVRDEDGGREGFYLAFCWLGWMVGLTISSSWAEHRAMADIRAERLAQEAGAGEQG